jgi:hypothetical protein
MALVNWRRIYYGVDVFRREEMYKSQLYGVGLAKTRE